MANPVQSTEARQGRAPGRPLLEVKGISKSFGGITAVSNFNTTVSQNQIVGIIGPNGAGKTTVLNMLSGVYQADQGEVLLDGQNLVGKPTFEIGRAGISRTFQNIRLFQDMNVFDTVRTAYSWRAQFGLVKAMLGWGDVKKFEQEVEEKVLGHLERVGLLDYRYEYPTGLSYGLQRRVELARALAGEPRLLLLDEPGAGLNPAEVLDLTNLVRKLHHDLNLAVILIDHRMELVLGLCDWINVLDFGRTIAQGTPDQIRRDPTVIKAYLGEEFE